MYCGTFLVPKSASSPFSPLVHTPAVALPVGFAQITFEYLARGAFGQHFQHIDRTGTFKACDLRPAMDNQVFLGRVHARTEDDESLDHLTPALVRYPDGSTLQHRRVIRERVLHFHRVDVLAARDDHIFLAIDHVEVAVFVHGTHVTRV